jgi:general secretion pathway protein J
MKLRLNNQATGCAGFTLLEVLVATVLMVVILSALATVTSQWMPNWHRGMARVQQLERLAVGLDRISADLSSAEFVPLNAVRYPMFDGTPLAVTFVRTAIGPNSKPGLEFVRLVERADQQGLALVRERSAFLPVAPEALPEFGDRVVLMRPPYRISFSYAGRDQDWQSEWQNRNELPALIRVLVRDAASDRLIVASTVVSVNVNIAANCVRAKIIAQCIASGQADDAMPGATSGVGAPQPVVAQPNPVAGN